MFYPLTGTRNPWSIFDELESLHEDMDRMLTGQHGRRGRGWRRRPVYPPMNVWSSKDGLVIDAELPGVTPEDVEISVLGDELTLSGKVNPGQDVSETTCHRRERPTGEFTRTLQLPFRADAERVVAKYTNGILRLTVPRSEAEKPRKVHIEG